MVEFGEAKHPRMFSFRPGRRWSRRPGRKERYLEGLCPSKPPWKRRLRKIYILNIGNMKYPIVTLGCPKNIVDSEGMGGILAAQGHTSVAQPGDADVVIVNTCSFIASARNETLGVLREMADGKTPGQKLVAAGCMAESHGALVGAVPGVDAILSTREWMKIGDVVAT